MGHFKVKWVSSFALLLLDMIIEVYRFPINWEIDSQIQDGLFALNDIKIHLIIWPRNNCQDKYDDISYMFRFSFQYLHKMHVLNNFQLCTLLECCAGLQWLSRTLAVPKQCRTPGEDAVTSCCSWPQRLRLTFPGPRLYPWRLVLTCLDSEVSFCTGRWRCTMCCPGPTAEMSYLMERWYCCSWNRIVLYCIFIDCSKY